MIVKDEAHVIKRCLDSLRAQEWIDYYYILDTGSTDGTQDIIREYFSAIGIDGVVADYPFTDFADCRNVALSGIKGNADMVFWIDADEQLYFSDDFDFDKLKYDMVNYDFAYFNCFNNGFKFRNIHLFNIWQDWEWHGLVHEFLRKKDGSGYDGLESTEIAGCSLVYNEDGASWKDKIAKAEKHISLLLQQHKEEPLEGRWLFYLGQSYRAINTPEATRLSIKYYEARADMYLLGRDAEAYSSRMLALCLKQQLGAPLTAKHFLDCSRYDSSRIEHLLYAIDILAKQRSYQSAYNYSSEAYRYFMKPPSGMYDLASYTFSCAHVHAINCFYVGKKIEGLKVLERLMLNVKSGESPSLVAEDQLLRLKNALLALPS